MNNDPVPELKRQLAIIIGKWIYDEKLNQDEAAEILGIHRPEVSNIQRGKLEKFSLDSLLQYAWRAGRLVSIKVID